MTASQENRIREIAGKLQRLFVTENVTNTDAIQAMQTLMQLVVNEPTTPTEMLVYVYQLSTETVEACEQRFKRDGLQDSVRRAMRGIRKYNH